METRASGGAALPVGKIVCVGRNYAEHAKELGNAIPEEPVLFLKPATALHLGDGTIELPAFSDDVQHEVELVVRVGKSGKHWTAAEAEAAIDAFTVGLDLTARDLQSEAKRKGLPWAVAKGFDQAAPIGELYACRDLRTVLSSTLQLLVNGEMRQHAPIKDMQFSVPSLVAFISSRFRLESGDLIFTGTPSGVGSVKPGDHLVATLGTLARLELWIAPLRR